MKITSIKSLFVALVALLTVQYVNAEERVVATVDGYPIMQSQVKKALGKRANTEANRKKALEDAIDEFITQRAIQESGVEINYDYIDYMIEVIAAENGLTYGRFLDALEYQGMTINEYKQQIAHQMLMEQVRHQSIGKSIQIDPKEVEKLSKQLLEKAKSKGNLKKSTAKQYRISHILIKLNPVLDDKQAKAKLASLLADIKTEKISFEEAAALNSSDYVSAADGGDLGWNFLEAYDQSFANVAKKSKKNVVSEPFKSQFGWHILKVTDIRDQDRTEDVYLQKAYEQLVNKQAQEASKDWVKALKKRADIKYLQ